MKNPTVILVFLSLINLLNYIDRWLVSAVIPSMQKDLRMTDTQAGLIMSAFMLGYFLTSPGFGYLADRMKRFKLVIGGTVVWSIATFASGFGKTAVQIFLARTAVGVGEASTVSAGQSVIGDLYPAGQRNKAMAYFIAAIPVGAALGFVFGGILEHHWGWRTTFFIAGIPGLLLAAILAFCVEPVRGAMETQIDNATQATTLKEDILTLLRNKSYMEAVLGYTAYTFTLGGFASWAASYMVRVRHVPLTESDLIFGGITVVTGTLGSILGGYGSAAWLRKKPHGDLRFMVVTTALAIPFAFGTFLFSNKILFLFCMAATEFLLFLGQPAVSVVIMERAGPFLRGIATAFSIFMIHLLGDFISPPLVGWIADRTSLEVGVLILPAALFLSVYFYNRCLKTSLIEFPTH